MIGNYFMLFSNCLPVKGFKRSLILDLQRGKSFPIPNSMFEVIEFLINKNSIKNTILNFGKENKITIDDYLQFLISNDLGLYVKKSQFGLFPELNKTFVTPDHFTNIVIEISAYNLKYIAEIAGTFKNTKISNIQLIGYDNLNFSEISNILNHFKINDFQSCELVLKFNEEIISNIYNLDLNFADITNVSFHSVPNKFENNLDLLRFEVFFTTEIVDCFKFCGIVDLKYFNTNLPKVLESLNHNSCLHKKISIDKYGNIKNCPSMPQSFGNIKDTTLEEALNHKDFKKYWNVNKDMIAVCKDCEFRHICTDCRAYTERNHFEEDIDLSKPLKCGYNPYTNEWAEWSTNPLKQKAIEYYGMQDLVKKDA
jgi:SPASM domain peptide maturase of grasp-with-spasm system